MPEETPPKSGESEEPPKEEEVSSAHNHEEGNGDGDDATETQNEEANDGEAIEEEPPEKKQKLEDEFVEVEKREKLQAEVAAEVKEEKLEEPDEAPKEEKEKKEKSPELLKLWKVVEDDPADFNGWTYLLQHVDASGDVEEGREGYDAFLHRYPYCYGYWKKYADLEKRKGSAEKVMMVFERGVEAIPLSADLWIHYLNHVREKRPDDPEEFVRAQYERSVAACGRDWRSDKLWDHYVKWEAKEKELPRVTRLYDRILRNQTQGLNHQFDMFRDFVKENHPKDVLDEEVFLKLRKEVLEAMGKESTDGEEEEEKQAMRERMILERRKVFRETEEKVQQRWKFEDNVKRPYFHMKPLERGQLKNWSQYLAAESGKKDADPAHVEVLFERCLIACALYEEFWLKYAEWLEGRLPGDGVLDKARDVYRRAIVHHMPDSVEVRVAWAAFEEQHGDLEKASELLKEVEARRPEMTWATMKRANLERRRGNHHDVHRLYKSCISGAKTTAAASEAASKYSRFLRFVVNDPDAAVETIEDAIRRDEGNAKLRLQLVDVHLHRMQPVDVRKVVEVFDSVLGKEKAFSVAQRAVFARRKVDFLEDFGPSAEEVAEARKRLEEIEAAAKAEKPGREADPAAKTTNSSVNGKSPPAAPSTTATTTYAATNSAAYGAQHASQYQQYGSRYSAAQYPSGYGQYGNYYSGYYQQ